MAMPDNYLLKPVADKDVEDIVVFLGLKSFRNYKIDFITVPLMSLIAQYYLYFVYITVVYLTGWLISILYIECRVHPTYTLLNICIVNYSLIVGAGLKL